MLMLEVMISPQTATFKMIIRSTYPITLNRVSKWLIVIFVGS